MFEKQLGEKLGEGAQKKVYTNKDKPDLAIGIFNEDIKETPQQIKGRYYLTKILHLLFPKQIPNIHLATSNPHMIEVDRVSVKKLIPKYESLEDKPLAERSLEDQLLKDRNILFKKILDLGVFPDYHYNNFGYDQDDNLVYLDSVTPWKNDRRLYDPKKIVIALNNLSENEKEQGFVFLKRLGDLYQEQIALNQNKEK